MLKLTGTSHISPKPNIHCLQVNWILSSISDASPTQNASLWKVLLHVPHIVCKSFNPC